MGQVAEFQKELEKRFPGGYGRWFKVDLHNHSPVSFDYEDKSETVKDAIIAELKKPDKCPAVVMFTDHETLPSPEFCNYIQSHTGTLILRGVELNCFVDAYDKGTDKVGRNLYYHLLVGFDPNGAQTPEYWLQEIYRECRAESRSVGSRNAQGVPVTITRLAEVLADSGALIIPAHLHSERNSWKSRSIDNIYEDEQFLRDVEQHFTAIEVTNQLTAAYFDGQHPETKFLNKSCIWSSDSHNPSRRRNSQSAPRNGAPAGGHARGPRYGSGDRTAAPHGIVLGAAQGKGVALRYTLMTGEARKKGERPRLQTAKEDVDDTVKKTTAGRRAGRMHLPSRDDILRKASGMHTLKTRSVGALLVAALCTLAFSARAEEVLITFDNAAVDTPPADFSIALTGGGGPVAWVIKDDPTAPSGGKVLAQTSADTTSNRFPLCVYEPLTARDVEVAVQFKAVAGKVDQAAGLVVRFQDKDNYYITRANALENNVRLYKVMKGKRKRFAGANVQVSAGDWHTLKLTVQGARFQVFFDEKLVFAATDKTFTDAGKVGLWTKADSVTYFDNLSIMPHDTR